MPVQALLAMSKGKFASALRRHYKAGRLRLGGLCRHLRHRRAFSQLLKKLMAEGWVAYAKPPFAGPEQLLGYLGRYAHRAAIGNRRIVSMGKDTVCFRWRDYAGGSRQKVMCLPHEEFIRRFLQHCLPARFCKIRYSSPAEASAKAGWYPVQPVAKAGFGHSPAGFGGEAAASASGSFLAGRRQLAFYPGTPNCLLLR